MLAVARPSGGAYRRFARYYDLIYHGLVNYEGDVDFLECEFWHGPAARPSPFQTWTHIAKKDIEIVRLDEARFDPRTGRLPVEFRFFVFGAGRVLDRFDELHTIQTYTVRGMRELLRRGGFNLLGTFAATNVNKGFRPVSRNTFRIMAVARAR